jgi:hypothetical protein
MGAVPANARNVNALVTYAADAGAQARRLFCEVICSLIGKMFLIHWL